MCGIAGSISWHESTRHFPGRIARAVAAMHRRGPDAEGVFESSGFALGHARLAIFDTSNASAQPFHSSCGRYVLVFNGEIFNFRNLRENLQSKGVSFRSSGDSEVLLECFKHYGHECLHMLNGFFAFAIADLMQHEIFIARDRFGEKPLLVYRGAHGVCFASTLTALLQFGIPRTLNADALQAYLHLNYVPPQLSIVEHVQPLPPGSWMRIAAHTGKITAQQWYTLPQTTAMPPSFMEAASMLEEKLTVAVARRLEADVPLGAFLSGGIDSSVVAAIGAKLSPGLRTFSIGFPDAPLFDETPFAKQVAAHIGTAHTVFPVTQNDLAHALGDTLAAMDEPFADTSALAVNILSRHVRSQVTVALSGDGADELLGGYHKHRAWHMLLLPQLKHKLVAAGAPLWNMLPASRNSSFGNRVRQLRRFAEGMQLGQAQRYWRWAGYTKHTEALQLLQSHWQRPEALQICHYLPQLDFSSADAMNAMLHADTAFVLPGDMLVKVDRMSMHHSLEVRPPFLDHEVAGWIHSLPAHYKIDAQGQKRLLKAAFAHMLPETIFTRRKQGFEVPVLQWLRTDLHEELLDLCAPDTIRNQGIFSHDVLQALFRQLHSTAPADAAARVWGIYVFQKKYAEIFTNEY
ncbi:MAG: asparagine synthase (glutamine-hydrolyzing) [Bacteroidetes bacterium]|nr:asparagine synthase (glutamine-hydrolyzing) [Bacteroidota bacterium]